MIKNRHEILFIYDVTDANPNGDPLDENKPRMDEETNTNIVTDVRLKRTIRDYLYKQRMPGLINALKLSRAMGITLDELVGRAK